MPDPLPRIALKKRDNKSRAVDAAVAFIQTQRGGPGNNQGRIPRRAIENAATASSGLNRVQFNAALADAYDELAALGLVAPRA